MLTTLTRSLLAAGLAGCVLTLSLTAQDSTQAAPARAETKVATIGEPAPAFRLPDTAGKTHSLKDLVGEGRIVVLEWFNPDCPFVVNFHGKSKRMKELAAAYKDRDVVWVAINSGAPGLQGAGLERNLKAIAEYEIEYPVLLDEEGTAGRAYAAKTTPHMYIIDGEGVLRYAGAIDDSNGRGEATRNHVKAALDELLADKPVSVAESKPYGCSVKYGR